MLEKHMKKLTKEQILGIPKMKQNGYTDLQIAKMLDVDLSTVSKWKKRLREDGHKVVNLNPGPRALKL